jgi:hypothetical protein
MTRPREGPTRDGARTRADRFTLQRVAASLTDRDLKICEDVHEHRILTSTQLYELHFTSISRARKRLVNLYRLGVLWRTRPRKRPGSLPHHYALDQVGALVLAESRGIDVSELGFRFDRTLGLIDSIQLQHLREVNGFFTRLVQACRQTDGAYRLALWWGERRFAERWEGLVRPDGMGVLTGPEGRVRFALELDRGTESRSRLEEKLERYLVVASATGGPEAILFCFPTPEREMTARMVLGGTGLLVATTTPDRHWGAPLGKAWRPIRADRRVRLIDLAEKAAMPTEEQWTTGREGR